MKNLIVFLLFFWSVNTNAQFTYQWGRAGIGATEVFASAADNFGNVFGSGGYGTGDTMNFGGHILIDTSSHLSSDMYVVKLDSLGNYLWAIGTMSINCQRIIPINMVTDKTGNLYIYGEFRANRIGAFSFSFGGFSINDSINQVACFLAKISPAGNVLFLHKIIGDYAIGRIGIDDSSYLYISGQFSGIQVIGHDTLSSGYDKDGFLGKFDSLGNVVWIKSIAGHASDALAISANGTIYYHGIRSDTVIFGLDTLFGNGAYILKINSNGLLLWAKKVNINTGYITVDKFENIYSTGIFSGNYILGSDTLRTNGRIDVFISKFDSSYNLLWSRSGGGLGDDSPGGIEVDTFGNVFIYGNIEPQGGAYTVNFDGFSLNSTPLWGDPCFIAEYSSCGKIKSAYVNSSGGDDVLSCSLTKNGSFYLFIDYLVTMVLGVDTFISHGGEPPFFAKFKYNVYQDTMASTLLGMDSLCNGASISISGSVTSGLWYVANNSASVVDGWVTGINVGWDTIIYITRNVCGVSASYKPIYIMERPDAGIVTGPSTVCVGDTILLSDTVGGLRWLVTNTNAGFIGSSLIGLHQGIDSALFIATKGVCSDTAIKVITILPLPYAGNIVGPNFLCINDTAQLIDSVAGGIWSVTNNRITDTMGKVRAIKTGKDTILYTVTNSCGIAIATHTIMVKALTDPGSISARDICDRDTLQVSETQAGGNWSCSNSNAVIIGNSLVGLAPGVDTILYSLTNECGTAIASKTVNILPAPAVPVISRDGLVLSVPDIYNTYQWYMDGTTIPGANTWKYKISELGNYSIKVSLADGCSASSVKDDIKDCSPASLMVYPNPTYAKVYIDWCKPVTVRVSVDDGKTFPAMPLIREVDLTGLPNANYFLAFYDEHGNKIGVKQVTKMGR